ncbi:MAG: CinA family protein [Candidatus Kaelpia imicola]|nr:CinA family protein [Candidatus Kaelpia imicola]
MSNTARISYKISSLLKKHNLTISSAESCTGGLLASSLTDIAGSSSYFKTGFIAYNRESKLKYLKIDKDTINNYGTISKECAKEMANNIRSLTDSEIGISTTGILGPQTIENKLKGEIYIAISLSSKSIVKKLRLKGNRAKIKKEAVTQALKMLYQQLCRL